MADVPGVGQHLGEWAVMGRQTFTMEGEKRTATGDRAGSVGFNSKWVNACDFIINDGNHNP